MRKIAGGLGLVWPLVFLGGAIFGGCGADEGEGPGPVLVASPAPTGREESVSTQDREPAPPVSLPELPADLGRISGRIVLAGERLQAISKGRHGLWRTAVFLEHLPEDRWADDRAKEARPRKFETVVWQSCAGAKYKLVPPHTAPHRTVRPRTPGSSYLFDPPILFLRTGDFFLITVKGYSDGWDLSKILRPETGSEGESSSAPAFEDGERGGPDAPYPRGEWFYAMRMTCTTQLLEKFLDCAWDRPTGTFGHGHNLKSRHDPARYFRHRLGVEKDPDLEVWTLPPTKLERPGAVDMIKVPYCEPFFVIGVQNPYHTLVDVAHSPEFVLDRVPPGDYWLRTFDPFFASVQVPLRVRAGEVTQVEVVIDERRLLDFYFMRNTSEPTADEVADELAPSPPADAISCEPASRGAIQGRIATSDSELSAIARGRPPVYRTAVFIERVDEETWRSGPAFPPAAPLALRLTREYAGAPYVERSAGWVFAPSTINLLGYRDCLRLEEPAEYREEMRPALFLGTAEVFEPGAGRLFVGRSYENTPIWEWVDRPKRDPFRQPVLPFLTHPLQRRIDRSQDLRYPLLRAQGWGRVEALYRTSRQTESVSAQFGFGDQAPLYLVGVQNPYHTLVDLHGDGTFRIEGVPAGTHWLRTFDAHFATVRQQVTVEPGGTTQVGIVFSERQSH